MESKSEESAEDDETEGFNYDCGKTFIYPTNISLRDYQYKIVNEALFKNTMVCLPTGLGKTFIAAVVMYNFFRWYPNGKIIFMAPTKPLVKQQVDACYNIMAIPKASTAELTGNTVQATRDEIWEEKRVFFITPQVLQNDLERVAVLGKKIKCLVFDEAHRARGNHAYCEVIRKLLPVSRSFRVLALSATPGNTVNDVVKVCEGLLIAHLEMRTEDSADVTPFTHKKVLETVVVKLDEKLKEVYNDFITKVLDKYVRVLIKHQVVTGNCSTLTKGKLFYILEDYKKEHRQRGAANNEVLKNLNICLILYHAFEVLTKHGLRVFLNYLEGQCEKPLLKSDDQIKVIIEDLNNYLGPRPVLDVLPDGKLPEVPSDLKYGHPKYYKLENLLIDHYKNNDTKSKVIVFCEYRDSVMEVYTALLKHQSLIKPKIFLGQGVISQKQQNNVIEAFRSGKCNTLVSSCIGEEGLDVGEVDLVVCFDISNKSSIRLVQRMGRTGRKRDGKVIMLVTEGKEHQLLQDSLRHKDYMANTILHSKELQRTFYKNNPRMVPKNVNPVCEKRYITVEKPKQKLANNDLKSMFNNMNQSTATIMHFEDRIPTANFNFTKTNLSDILDGSLNNKLLVPIEQQRTLQSSYGEICSSKNSKVLFHLLQFSDSKRYKLPQVHGNSIRSKYKTEYVQGDIRNMFLQNSSQTNYKPSQRQSTAEEQLEKEINDYLLTIKSSSGECNLCKYFFECNSYHYKEESVLNSWIPIDESLLCSITNESINEFLKTSSKTKFEPTNISLDDCDDIFENIIIDENEEKEISLSKEVEKSIELCDSAMDYMENQNSNFERESELENKKVFDSPIMSPKEFEAPKSIDKIFQKYTLNEPELETHDVVVEDGASNLRSLEKLYHKTLAFFKLDSIEDLFKSPEKDWIDSDSPVLTPFEDRKTYSQKNQSNPENSIIEDVLTSPVLYSNRTPTKQSQYSSQRSRAVESPDLFDSDSDSSIIIKEKQDNKEESCNDFDRSSSANLVQPQTKLSLDDICDNSLLYSITGSQKSVKYQESVNDFDRSSSGNLRQPQTKLSLDDICDTSLLHSITESQKSVKYQESVNDFDRSSSANLRQPQTKLSLDDICDTSLLHSIPQSQKSIQHQEKLSLNDICDMSIMNIISETKEKSANQNDLLIEDLCDNSILDMFKQSESIANFSNKSNNNLHSRSKSSSGKVPSSSSPAIKPRKRLATKLTFDSTCNESISDDDFEDCTVIKSKTTKRAKRKNKANDFLELEAEVSGSGSSDDDEDGSSQDMLEDSFVDDHSTQSNFNTTTMQALYIQTTRSPVLGGGKFKIPNVPKVVNQTIFSQEEPALDNTYLEDSFCVNSEVIDLTVNDDLSELEEAEKLLADKRKKKKSVSEDQRRAKRRRIIVLSDSD